MKLKKNLWDLKSFVIGRYNFGESLDVFMEQPVWREKTNHRFSFCACVVTHDKCDAHISYLPKKA